MYQRSEKPVYKICSLCSRMYQRSEKPVFKFCSLCSRMYQRSEKPVYKICSLCSRMYQRSEKLVFKFCSLCSLMYQRSEKPVFKICSFLLSLCRDWSADVSFWLLTGLWKGETLTKWLTEWPWELKEVGFWGQVLLSKPRVGDRASDVTVAVRNEVEWDRDEANGILRAWQAWLSSAAGSRRSPC